MDRERSGCFTMIRGELNKIDKGYSILKLFKSRRVLYFSIHRYECGTFWPNLRESDFDYIGEGAGLGYNFNVPLNRIGMTNGDYLAIWQQLLLPVALEVSST